MSELTVERSRRSIEAFNAHDVEGFLALCDPGIEIQSVFAAVGGAVYQGHDGVRRWFRELREAWGEEIRLEEEKLFDLGEHTLAFQVIRGRGRQSGANVALPSAAVAKWRDGLGVSLKVYVRREDALTDLGVKEDELEPVKQ